MEQEIEKSQFADYNRLISVGRNFLISKKKLPTKELLKGGFIQLQIDRKLDKKQYLLENCEIIDFDHAQFVGKHFVNYKKCVTNALLKH